MKKILIKKQIKDELVTKKYLDIKLSPFDKKFDSIDKKFDSIDNRFRDIDNRFKEVGNRFDLIDKKLDKTVHYMNLKFDSIEEKLTKLDTIDERLESIMKTLDWLAGEYKKLDEEHVVGSEQTHRLNNKLDNHEGRIFNLEQKVVTST